MLCFCATIATASEVVPGDSILITKNNFNRTHRISIYPDANHKVMFFSVRGSEGKIYQLYVFDLDGKLVKQAETRNRQTTLLKGIAKGLYMFEVFSDDKRIANGQIDIR